MTKKEKENLINELEKIQEYSIIRGWEKRIIYDMNSKLENLIEEIKNGEYDE